MTIASILSRRRRRAVRADGPWALLPSATNVGQRPEIVETSLAKE
jgi:hypothetical protein